MVADLQGCLLRAVVQESLVLESLPILVVALVAAEGSGQYQECVTVSEAMERVEP